MFHDEDIDDTFSFEAIERKLKTPSRKQKPKPEAEIEKPGVKDNESLHANMNQQSEFKSPDKVLPKIEIPSQVKYKKKYQMFGGNNNNSEKDDLIRSVSCLDLGSAVNEGTNEVVINRSCSSMSLHNSWLSEFQESFRQYKEQHAELDTEFESLLLKSQKRREKFKEYWGVSPKNINRLLTKRKTPRDYFVEIPEQDINFNLNENENENDGINLDGSHVILSDNEDDKPVVKKSVRFVNATPPMTSSNEQSNNNNASMIQVNVPLHVGLMAGHISFSELENSNVFEKTPCYKNATTPMALKHISSKAQQELAALYDFEEEEEEVTDHRKTLNYDEEEVTD